MSRKKGLPYYKRSLITDVKSFVELGPGVDVMNTPFFPDAVLANFSCWSNQGALPNGKG
jgi:hypothetical protein